MCSNYLGFEVPQSQVLQAKFSSFMVVIKNEIYP